MRFRAPPEGADEIHVRTTTGHAAVVGKEWRDLPENLHAHAIRAGCEVDRTASAKDSTPKAAKGAEKPLDDKTVIRGAIETLVKKGDADDFTTDGTPKVASVKAASGLNVGKDDVTAVWAEMTAELEADTQAKNAKANKVESGE
ncbi:MAG TPA: hypothetical protein VLE97_01905 [Gaiellaceae bacterium]|nr:hypothetical protein [Gaiellaceae bacterium]